MKRRWLKPLAWRLGGIVLVTAGGWWRFVGGPKLLYNTIGQGKTLTMGGESVTLPKAAGENAATVQLLLRLGVSPNQRDAYDEQTPLHKAVNLEDLATCRVLLEAGASPNSRDRFDDTPLHSVMHHQKEDVLELLLAHGANPNLENKDGATPLHAPFEEVEEFQGLTVRPFCTQQPVGAGSLMTRARSRSCRN